jgi:lipopolysaccharide transport system permease protein/teichoic acid transport system permease protein
MVKQLIPFLKELFAEKSKIWELVKRDLKTRFAGSFLGIFWLFAQPFITILVFWFVFEVGFKSIPVENFPFILWLICGMIPWFFFAEAIMTATYSIVENAYLVKNVTFRVSLLPIVKIVSAFLVHLFFIIIIFLMFAFYGYYPDIYWFQLIYYLFAMILLLTGLSLITSSSMLFFKDIGQFIQACMQFLFWCTPIFWSLNIIPKKYHFMLKINPLFYIINGYRECLVNKVWPWEHPRLTLYFWVITVVIFLFGAVFFKKLRPHFGDVA